MPSKATRPLEYVCLFPADLPTKEGDVFVFLFVDAYSQLLFNTGVERDREPLTVLKHIDLLMKNKNFCKHKKNGFTLVLHKYDDLIPLATSIVQPHNGTVIVNAKYVAKVMAPALKEFVSHISKRI